MQLLLTNSLCCPFTNTQNLKNLLKKKTLLIGRLLGTDVTAWVSAFPSDMALPVRASSFQQDAFAFWAPLLVPWRGNTARAGLNQLARVGLLVSKLAGSLWQPFYKESQARPQKLCEKYEGQGRLLSRTPARMRFLVFFWRATGKFVFFKLKLVDIPHMLFASSLCKLCI